MAYRITTTLPTPKFLYRMGLQMQLSRHFPKFTNSQLRPSYSMTGGQRTAYWYQSIREKAVSMEDRHQTQVPKRSLDPSEQDRQKLYCLIRFRQQSY